MAKTVKRTHLKLGFLNVRSLTTGQDELQASMQIQQPDILALNETWLQEDAVKYAPSFSGYSLKHRSRPGDRRGGRVGFYVKRGIRVHVRSHPESALEQLWLEVCLPGYKVAVGTVYRSESIISVAKAIEALAESIQCFVYCKHIIILSDFNVNMLEPQNYFTKELNTFLTQHDLEQMVKEPTRITEVSESLLDLVITDTPDRCLNISVHHNQNISDHAMIIAFFDIRKPKPSPCFKSVRLFKNIDLNSFNSDLDIIPWKNISKEHDVNTMVYMFDAYISHLFDIHAPFKRIKVGNVPTPWITDVIKIMMTLRDEALARFHKTKSEAHKNYYKQLKNLVTSSLRQEKKAYFKFYVNNNSKNPKDMWRHLKSISILNDSCGPSIPDHLNVADDINNFFLDLPGNTNADLDTLQYFKNSKLNENHFELKKISEKNVIEIINTIKTKAYGHDLVNIDMIRMTLPKTLETITSIINKSIETKVFPDSWKIALVKPIPKTRHVIHVKDLRPISILPVISKIIERVVEKQLKPYLESNSILPLHQSGFRSGHGTATALTQVTDDILSESDAGKSTILVLLDFSRAFDCLHRELLLAKLIHYGISTESSCWFRSYLTNRYQQVITDDGQGNNVKSKMLPTVRGVPQGSILSPLLFVVFTADLPNILEYCLRSYMVFENFSPST
ncbi:unnamed protein product [Arctia plantaginis]|uniref:Reverse transcriptase domain-containing protein n=1 Tax=Arctia plantaginis TaxID=874455 RepID=A0A8S0Z6U9_ARCPL|nr:unnamed protein product [Arctia plantaginis]